MTVDDLLEQLRMISAQGQGDLPVVNDDDYEVMDVTVDSDQGTSGMAVLLDFERHPRGHFD